MSEKIVAGVDFSGAKEVPNQTWLAVGKLGGLGLEIIDLRQVGSHALAREVSALSSLSALGIDCPFSLPEPFLEFMATKTLRKEHQSWQEVAEQLAFMSFDNFVEMVKEFKKEPKRFADTVHSATTQSPLHRGNPSMVQMTFHGIRLLSALDPKRFFVLPFQEPIDFGCPVIEVFPRQMLAYFALAETGYKGQDKKGETKLTGARKALLDALIKVRDRKGVTYQDCPRLTVPKKFEHDAVSTDNALDAIIACYATALFVAAPQLFADPLASDRLEVLLEGWIYAPQPPGK
jgi:hypothetical protein